jgi:hypothetical protein
LVLACGARAVAACCDERARRAAGARVRVIAITRPSFERRLLFDSLALSVHLDWTRTLLCWLFLYSLVLVRRALCISDTPHYIIDLLFYELIFGL